MDSTFPFAGKMAFLQRMTLLAIGVFKAFQKTLRLHGGHATGAGGADSLTEKGILHVTGGKYAGEIGFGTVSGQDIVPFLVRI